MENKLLFYSVVASEVVSFLCIFFLAKKPYPFWLKIIIVPVTLTPFIGPIMYLFVADDTPPQKEHLQNRGPRGAYTHQWISTRGIWQRRRNVESEDDVDKAD